MRIIISARNINLSEKLKEVVGEKLSKLDKYFATETEAQVTLSAERDRKRIEVTIPLKGHVIRAEQESDDIYVSIDLVEEILERQVRKYKTKLLNRKHNNYETFKKEFIEEEIEEDEKVDIVRVKKFMMKPMTAEEACVQMELLGHDFYMFINGDTGIVNVVYKRKNNNYGLIEPELM